MFYYITSVPTIAQSVNLVGNGSFEDIESCPDEFGQLAKVVQWHSPSDGTPDLFATCNHSYLGIPMNGIGNENAFDGEAYSGIILYNTLEVVREYLQRS